MVNILVTTRNEVVTRLHAANSDTKFKKDAFQQTSVIKVCVIMYYVCLLRRHSSTAKYRT